MGKTANIFMAIGIVVMLSALVTGPYYFGVSSTRNAAVDGNAGHWSVDKYGHTDWHWGN